MGGKATDRDRRERVTQGVEPAHAGAYIAEKTGDRERKVYIP